ncbi:Thymidylate synthase [Salmonella phage SPFM14]|nr:Thymidylate synthase [Salmonella phage SPFM14]
MVDNVVPFTIFDYKFEDFEIVGYQSHEKMQLTREPLPLPKLIIKRKPEYFVWSGGDVHLYSNHLEQAKLASYALLVHMVAQQVNMVPGVLSCQLYQRSADFFLGVPFNTVADDAVFHVEMDALEIPRRIDWFEKNLPDQFNDSRFSNEVAPCHAFFQFYTRELSIDERPDSRRIIVSAWNVGELDQMACVLLKLHDQISKVIDQLRNDQDAGYVDYGDADDGSQMFDARRWKDVKLVPKKNAALIEKLLWREWQDENGNLGPLYGAQWMLWFLSGDTNTKYLEDNGVTSKGFPLVTTKKLHLRSIIHERDRTGTGTLSVFGRQMRFDLLIVKQYLEMMQNILDEGHVKGCKHLCERRFKRHFEFIERKSKKTNVVQS